MPYEVISNTSVDLLVSYGDVTDPATGAVLGQDQSSQVWLPGEVVPDDEVHPRVVEQYEDGDEHIRSLIKKVSGKRTKASASDDDDSADNVPEAGGKSGVKPSQVPGAQKESARAKKATERGDQGGDNN